MRILMASHGYPPVISGVTLVVQKLARAMVERGHAVLVVTASDLGDRYWAVDQGVQLMRVNAARNPFWEEGLIPYASRAEMREIIEEFRPGVIHVHDAAVLAVQTLRLNENVRAPAVATCYYVPKFATRFVPWAGQPRSVLEALAWAYSIWLYEQFDHVVFATEAHRRFFANQGLRVPTSIISNGIDERRYRPLAGALETVGERYGLPARPRVLFVGRLMRDKEIGVLIRAMAIVREERDAHLLIAGRGDEREALGQLVSELGLQEAVRFLGFFPEEDMPALYREVDLFAITSRCEVQSLPVLQAVATGLPVVAANAVALPELVKDGVNGYLVPPGGVEETAQAILAVLNDPEQACRFGEASLQMAEPHAEERTFDRYESLYEQMGADEAGIARLVLPAGTRAMR
jgi:1,2-diacylglycerol 3-alpha-glucosyltransferase